MLSRKDQVPTPTKTTRRENNKVETFSTIRMSCVLLGDNYCVILEVPIEILTTKGFE
jgi:hypothetical protein